MKTHSSATEREVDSCELNEFSDDFQEINGYKLSRFFWEKSFEIHECKAKHAALYFWIVDLANRLGWKAEFGLPSSSTMEALKESNRSVYLKTLRDLDSWGFIKIVSPSKNQYQATIISLCSPKYGKANGKALGKALLGHSYGHYDSTIEGTAQGTDSITKQEKNKTIKPLKNKTGVVAASSDGPEDINDTMKKVFNETTRKRPGKKKNENCSIVTMIRREVEKINPDYYWEGKDGKATQDLVDKIRFRFNKKHGREPSDEEVVHSFVWFINNLPEFYSTKWEMTILSSRFNSIMTDIEANRGRTTNQSSLQNKLDIVDRGAEYLKAMMNQ